ncbi:hypothetical protein EL17_09585 [Anditalea andensis]|uniref:Uncharacterized protein n=1 Tax=Anditalea andensis TaxID=1048983 RepID=A0A074LIX9_9BACT|nr:hypothetical protein EL17_09585 [Anditalea andensis]
MQTILFIVLQSGKIKYIYNAMKSSMSKSSHTGVIIYPARFSRINSGQAIPTAGTGQHMTFKK